ncbi:hypothetical protein A8D95_31080 [Burkholderia cenocepacia]|nr:hypothetical protein A8D88_16070 [Burkholderia cenocepacia]ONP83103.1 hypothetical protein A8D94_00685 [Burkholderia cenocepacia]ONQ19253.1 hypothetical protein A8D95_31080 [Burkholderia cenocepacia]ONQ87917.1 hypothetical protein A8E08_28795 [Burkholderia cenocepacia]ONT07104.1 hypothetical protein A8E37_05910 [Burkholderia cenocepacia]
MICLSRITALFELEPSFAMLPDDHCLDPFSECSSALRFRREWILVRRDAFLLADIDEQLMRPAEVQPIGMRVISHTTCQFDYEPLFNRRRMIKKLAERALEPRSGIRLIGDGFAPPHWPYSRATHTRAKSPDSPVRRNLKATLDQAKKPPRRQAGCDSDNFERLKLEIERDTVTQTQISSTKRGILQERFIDAGPILQAPIKLWNSCSTSVIGTVRLYGRHTPLL